MNENSPALKNLSDVEDFIIKALENRGININSINITISANKNEYHYQIDLSKANDDTEFESEVHLVSTESGETFEDPYSGNAIDTNGALDLVNAINDKRTPSAYNSYDDVEYEDDEDIYGYED